MDDGAGPEPREGNGEQVRYNHIHFIHSPHRAKSVHASSLSDRLAASSFARENSRPGPESPGDDAPSSTGEEDASAMMQKGIADAPWRTARAASVGLGVGGARQLARRLQASFQHAKENTTRKRHLMNRGRKNLKKNLKGTAVIQNSEKFSIIFYGKFVNRTRHSYHAQDSRLNDFKRCHWIGQSSQRGNCYRALDTSCA